jgi:hypothetical protein
VGIETPSSFFSYFSISVDSSIGLPVLYYGQNRSRCKVRLQFRGVKLLKLAFFVSFAQFIVRTQMLSSSKLLRYPTRFSSSVKKGKLMKRLISAATAAALLLMFVATVDAQPGGRGPGGPGGGMRGQQSLFDLVGIEGVADDLELSEDQVADVKKAGEEYQKIASKKREEAIGGIDFRNATEEERAELGKKMEKVGQELLVEQQKALKDVLLGHQIERLEELRIQQMGVRALLDPAVAEKLKISKDQQEKIQEAQDSIREKMMAMFRGGEGERPDPTKMQEEMTKLREQAEKDAMEILNADQASQFAKMKGKTFEFPAIQFGQGGRGQGRGQGGQGNNGGERPRPQAD